MNSLNSRGDTPTNLTTPISVPPKITYWEPNISAKKHSLSMKFLVQVHVLNCEMSHFHPHTLNKPKFTIMYISMTNLPWITNNNVFIISIG